MEKGPLLSLNLDPFSIAAEKYERRNDWGNVITIRERAVLMPPFNKTALTEGLARDHYLLGQSYERDGRRTKAFEEYVKAGEYVSPSSEYRQRIFDGIRRREEK